MKPPASSVTAAQIPRPWDIPTNVLSTEHHHLMNKHAKHQLGMTEWRLNCPRMSDPCCSFLSPQSVLWQLDVNRPLIYSPRFPGPSPRPWIRKGHYRQLGPIFIMYKSPTETLPSVKMHRITKASSFFALASCQRPGISCERLQLFEKHCY